MKTDVRVLSRFLFVSHSLFFLSLIATQTRSGHAEFQPRFLDEQSSKLSIESAKDDRFFEWKTSTLFY